MVENGLALNDVLTDLYEEVCEADLPEIPKAELLSVRPFQWKASINKRAYDSFTSRRSLTSSTD